MTFTGAQVRPTERHFFYNHTGYVLLLSIGTGTSIAIASFIRKRGSESVNRVTDLMVHLRSEQDTIWRLYDLSFKSSKREKAKALPPSVLVFNHV
jgi:hypothetical protein